MDNTGTGRWEAILKGDDRAQAETAVLAIAEDLCALANQNSLPVAELSDLALFCEYVSEGLSSEQHSNLADIYMQQSIDLLATTDISPGFLDDGLADIGWVQEHLYEAEEEGSSTISDVLIDKLGEIPWPGNYDLVNGLSGYGLYFYEGTLNSNQFSQNRNREGLALVIRQLQAMRKNDATWHKAPQHIPDIRREATPNGYYDFGVAHGVPGVLVILALAASIDVEAAIAIPMADTLVDWILTHKQDKEKHGSYFPSIWTPESPNGASRSAWCYGDPGLASALLWAAELLHRPEWKENAIAILRDSTSTGIAQSQVRDAALCHGSTGLAQVYNRAYQHTRESTFQECAQRWYCQTLQMRGGSGIGGFQSLTSAAVRTAQPALEFKDCPGFLAGAIGIGLALLAGISTVEPNWDRRLLISSSILKEQPQ